jgi:hypothetical protein
LSHPSEKYEFVSWDDDIPNMMGKIIQMFQTTNQIIDPNRSIHFCSQKSHMFVYMSGISSWGPWFFSWDDLQPMIFFGCTPSRTADEAMNWMR